MGEKVYKLSEEQSDLLMGDLGATLEKLSEIGEGNIDLKEQIELLKSLIGKELKDTAGDIKDSNEALEKTYELIVRYFSTGVKRITELEGDYKQVMGESKEEFKGMVKEFVAEKLSDLKLNQKGIQLVVDKQLEAMIGKLDYSALKTIQKEMQAVLDNMKKDAGEKLESLAKMEVKANTLTLAKADAIYKNIETQAQLVEDAARVLKTTSRHMEGNLKNQNVGLVSALRETQQALKETKELNEIVRKEAERGSKKSLDNWYFFFGITLGITIGTFGTLFLLQDSFGIELAASEFLNKLKG